MVNSDAIADGNSFFADLNARGVIFRVILDNDFRLCATGNYSSRPSGLDAALILNSGADEEGIATGLDLAEVDEVACAAVNKLGIGASEKRLVGDVHSGKINILTDLYFAIAPDDDSIGIH